MVKTSLAAAVMAAVMAAEMAALLPARADPDPSVATASLALLHAQDVAAGFDGIGSDPFNPLPWHDPISRTRIEVLVTDDTTQCPRIWAAIPCPVVVMPDGTRQGLVIANYSHAGARSVTVERIEYSGTVTAGDAWPLHFVAVED